MEIKLTSSNAMKKIVSEILKMKGFSFNEEAETVFIENDSILP